MNLGKRLLSFAVAAGLLASLTGCGSQNSANSSSSASASQPTGTGSASSSAPQAAPEGFTVAYTPVSAAGDTFIVQDPATDYYGLVDSTGKEILSCQYGDMAYLTVNKLDPKFYVAVQEKGSYGVYDLTGSQVVAPSYDSIRGADFSDGFVVCYHDRYGVVDLTGQEIISLDYTGSSCSAQGMVAGTKQADDGYTVDLYNKDGSLSQSWPAAATIPIPSMVTALSCRAAAGIPCPGKSVPSSAECLPPTTSWTPLLTWCPLISIM